MGRLLALTGICASLAFAACGDDDDAPDSQPQAQATEASESPAESPTQSEQGADKEGGSGGGGGSDEQAGTTITTAGSQFGEALFDGDQRAIYYFDKEQGATSECYGACAEAWPPVLTEGEPEAGGAAEAKLLGTTDRDDGSTQVTYDGRPLYYYVDDPAGEILCHNVSEFGGLWLAVQPNGEAFS